MITENRSLVERYRPRELAELYGQPGPVTVLESYAENPYPQAFLFYGGTGTGKTSAAYALARALGCDVEQEGFGGLHVIASGEQSAGNVREVGALMHNIPFFGNGWRVFVVNECDRIHPQAEAVWLDILEHLPNKVTVIFTTNDASGLSGRFRHRCTPVFFQSDHRALWPHAMRLAKGIWAQERKVEATDREISDIVAQSIEGKELSFRLLVQNLSVALVSAGK